MLYDKCFAHIYSRALGKRFIFCDDDDFIFFKKLIRHAKQQYPYHLHHYCLMNTHFHMVVSLHALEDFSKSMKIIKEQYMRRFKKKYKSQGPVWWGRFGSQLIENEKYMYACGLYVEMNPVQAGMVGRPEEWEYSSSRHYFLNRRDDLLDVYAKPSYETSAPLMEGLNVGRGTYLGTPQFILNRGRGVA